MKNKKYITPEIYCAYKQDNEMAFPVVAAPLAILSAETAAAAVAGTVAGAVAASKALGDDYSATRMPSSDKIKGLQNV